MTRFQQNTVLTCKRGSVGQSEGLSIPRSSVRFRLEPDNSNSHEFELHRPSNKGTKLLLKVIKAIIIIVRRYRQSKNARVDCVKDKHAWQAHASTTHAQAQGYVESRCRACTHKRGIQRQWSRKWHWMFRCCCHLS